MAGHVLSKHDDDEAVEGRYSTSPLVLLVEGEASEVKIAMMQYLPRTVSRTTTIVGIKSPSLPRF